jgi:predicted RNase H-like nuclease (RuvC/YqgF family)
MSGGNIAGIVIAAFSLVGSVVAVLAQRRKTKADAAQVTTDTALGAADGVVTMMRDELKRLGERVEALEAENKALKQRVGQLEELLDENGIEHRVRRPWLGQP